MRPAAAFLLLIAVPLLAAPVPKVKEKTLEDKLLGKWKLVASQGKPNPNSNFHVAYLKDGELEFRYEYGEKEKAIVYKGNYKVGQPTNEDKLGTIDWTINQGATERGEVSRITELSDDVLEFKDPDGLVERFERVKEEKK